MIELLASGDELINPIDVNLKTSLWTLGIFVVLVVALRKLAWGPIVAGLQAREDRIAASLEKAAEIEKATRELAETNKKTLDEVRRQAQQIVSDARAAAKAAAEEIEHKAHAEIDASRERFQRELALETEKARASIRQDAVDLTLEAAGRLIGRSLGEADHRRLAEEALTDAETAARN